MATTLVGPAVLNVSRFESASDPTYVADVSVPLDNSYPAGGYLGLQALIQAKMPGIQGTIVEVLTALDAGSGLLVAWDAANAKLKLFWSATGAAAVQVTTATDLSAITLRLRILLE